MAAGTHPNSDDFGLLVAVPEAEVLEVVTDLGRPPEARLADRAVVLAMLR